MIKNLANLAKDQKSWLVESVLAITEELDFSQTCGFCSIIKNTVIKKRHINGLNFWQNPETSILDEYFFLKKNNFLSEKFGSTSLWHWTSGKISEKYYEPFFRKSVDWATDVLMW